MPAVRGHLTPKFYVDEAIFYWLNELSLLKLDPDEKTRLEEQDSIVPNSPLTSPRMIIEMPTKSYVDSLYENKRNRRVFSSVFDDQDNEFDNIKLTNLDSVTISRNTTLFNELFNKNMLKMN